jgi:hypothetical protein
MTAKQWSKYEDFLINSVKEWKARLQSEMDNSEEKEEFQKGIDQCDKYLKDSKKYKENEKFLVTIIKAIKAERKSRIDQCDVFLNELK